MYTFKNLVDISPVAAFQASSGTYVNSNGNKTKVSEEDKRGLRKALIDKFPILGQEFKELGMLKQFRTIAFTACALVGQPTVVAVAANFFDSKIKKKNEEIEKTLQKKDEEMAAQKLKQGVKGLDQLQQKIAGLEGSTKEKIESPKGAAVSERGGAGVVKGGTSQKPNIETLTDSEKAKLNEWLKEDREAKEALEKERKAEEKVRKAEERLRRKKEFVVRYNGYRS